MKTKIPRDKIHWSWRPLDGYNKPFNFAMSPREPGKTDSTWWEKIYCPWTINHKPWMYVVRQSVAITEALIQDIEDTLNKWSITPIEFSYKKGTFKDGIVDVKIGEQLFFRVVSLSIPLQRIKLAKIPNIGGVFSDEYIIDPRSGEKYLPNEAFKIKEAYTTWRRSYEGKGFLKWYFAGNPYSLFNPVFVDWDVEINKLRKGQAYVGDMFVIYWGVLHPELKKQLLEKNPFYKFDEEYTQYAMEGTAVNDANIRLGVMPPNYQLQFVLRYQKKNIGIFKNNYIEDLQDKYYCQFLDEVSARRTIYCFDFSDMMDRTILLSLDEREKLQRFKESMRKRTVVFKDINVYYFIEEIYKNL
ncbi:MAG: phage DNA encapsidation protein [Methanobrevibacter sp.]|nr:phage DNA encapsidation protein [Methanobrevibacter sp.]